MTLWQFVVIAALLGGVLVYARVLATKVSATNAALRRIEEALISNARRAERASAAAAEAVTVPLPPAAVSSSLPPPANSQAPAKERHTSYLTVRDLKVISRAARPTGEAAVAMSVESRDVPNVIRARQVPALDLDEGIVARSDSHDTVGRITELLGTPVTFAVNENLDVAPSEQTPVLSARSEPLAAPDIGVVNAEPAVAISVDQAALHAVSTAETVSESQSFSERLVVAETQIVLEPLPVMEWHAAAITERNVVEPLPETRGAEESESEAVATAVEPQQVAAAVVTAAEPQQVAPTVATATEPQQVASAVATAVEPQQVTPAVATAAEPQQVASTVATATEPQVASAVHITFEPPVAAVPAAQVVPEPQTVSTPQAVVTAETNPEQQTVSAPKKAAEPSTADPDLIEKRNRDAMLIMNSQRRRRRARGG